MKLYLVLISLAISFAIFKQSAAFAEMPRQCFTFAHFGTCERVQITAWTNRYTVNWEGVDAIRTFGNVN